MVEREGKALGRLGLGRMMGYVMLGTPEERKGFKVLAGLGPIGP